MHRFWLIRHALVHPDSLTCLYGTNDVPICEATMASDAPRYAALAARLPRPARWVATPLSRTQLTAAALFSAGYPAQPLQIEAAFVEQDFGDWQGLPITGFEAREPHQRHPFWPIHAAETPPNGESFDAHDLPRRRRAGGAARQRRHRRHRHRHPWRRHPRRLRPRLGPSAHQALSLSVENISLTRLEHSGHNWRLTSLNEPPAACQAEARSVAEPERQGALR